MHRVPPTAAKGPDLARRQTLLATLALLGAGCSQRDTPPDLRYTLLDGTQSSTGALRGKVVLVNFWATSCSICVKEMPALVATHLKFQPRGFETLAVAIQHDAPARVADFAQSRRLPFGVVIDNTGTVARGFGNVQVTPTHVLLDKHGTVARRWVGEPDFSALHARVEQLLSAA